MQILYEDDSLTVCTKEPGISSEDTILAARSPSAARTRAAATGQTAARPAAGNARSAPAAGIPATGSSPAAPRPSTHPSAASAGAAPDAAPGSVPALLRAHWGQPDAYVGVVHRLDLGVGGLMVYARTPAAAAALSRQVADRSFVKEYLCLCAGVPAPAQGQMRDYLFKDSRTRKVFPVKAARKGAKEALLDYAVLAEGTLSAASGAPAGGAAPQPIALCRVTLHTGRTHQIRVQFASRRHPLLGDGKYGSRVKGAIALQCSRLAFTHPKTGRRMEFTLPAPERWPLQDG